jgi:hypothetical protein
LSNRNRASSLTPIAATGRLQSHVSRDKGGRLHLPLFESDGSLHESRTFSQSAKSLQREITTKSLDGARR